MSVLISFLDRNSWKSLMRWAPNGDKDLKGGLRS